MYEIIDTHTKQVVGRCKTLRSAIRSVDRRDNAYGAYRYTHRKVEQIGTPIARVIETYENGELVLRLAPL